MKKFTKGIYSYDFGDTGCMTPLLKMYTLGHGFIPDPIHAGGLRYHGKAPISSLLVKNGEVEARSHNQVEAMEAALTFIKAEGLLPAPESAHSLKAVIDEALKCKKTDENKTILTLLSGHGYFDMKAYESYLEGKLEPYIMSKDKIEVTINEIKNLNP
jgi:tryptophan synthase beta chain